MSSSWETERLDERTLRQRCGLSFAEVLGRWRGDASFRASFTAAVAEAPFDGLFWETPAWTLEGLDAPYEHVLKESAAVASLRADPSAFEARFDGRSVVTFDNLGGDARLVVPAPEGAEAAYAQLARFLREGPAAQADALWPAVAGAMMERIGDAPTWLSTSGLGVPWVHVRLDARPKYYTHAPYRVASRA